MIRVKTILDKLFCLKISDNQLFHDVLADFSLSDAVCPCCGAAGCCVFHGAYNRDMISVQSGSRLAITVSVPRIRCKSCGHTHALLPDVLIPFGSYSLRFILTVLYGYLKRNCQVCDFCNAWNISVSTLYGWIHLFEDQASLWLGVLNRVKRISLDALNTIDSVVALPSSFFSILGFSFLQCHKTSHSDPDAATG